MNKTFTIPEIAEAYQSEKLFVPPIQRGLVWNAARIEILWDSLMRQIPIGALSVRASTNTPSRYDILDGQQRINAIALGLPQSSQANNPQHAILWLDLCPKVTDLEQSNGTWGKTARKFFFRVTTAAHPWGYKLSDNETSNKYLSAGEQREIVEHLSEHYNWKKQFIADRPSPIELWPKDALLPVPFPILYDFCKKTKASSFSDFQKWCQTEFSTNPPNWYQSFSKQGAVAPSQEHWVSIISAIRKLSETAILAVNANIDESDIGLYFKRMNKAGIEPSNEEINYSLLKSIASSLKQLDDFAEEKAGILPAQLASIALRYWKSTTEPKSTFATGVSLRDVSAYARDEKFQEFICGKSKNSLEHLLDMVNNLLDIKGDGLLPWHRSLIARQDGGVLLLFLLKEATAPRSGINYAGLAMFLSVFSTDLPQAVKHLWNADTIQQGIFTALQSNSLEFPLFKNELESFLKQTNGDTWNTDILSFLNDPKYVSRFNIIWPGFDKRKHAIEILLYSCRKYLRKVFEKYDTFKPEWQEQNCPWDYDHILPKSWIRAQDRTGNNYTAICWRFLWSIGNCAPIPFSLNREKNGYPPGINYPFGEQATLADIQADNGLCVNTVQIEKYTRNGWFDDNINAENIKVFVTTTARRVHDLYMTWFRNLSIENLLDFSPFVDSRKKLFSEIVQKLQGAKVYFAVSERDYPIENEHPCRWAAPALTVGKIVENVYFIAYYTRHQDGANGLLGIRKLPGEAGIHQATKEQIAKILNLSDYPIKNDPHWYGCREISNASSESIVVEIDKITQLIEKAPRL